MSIKVKQAIVTCLDKIADSTFDEDTIRTLLISCREKIHVDGLVRDWLILLRIQKGIKVCFTRTLFIKELHALKPGNVFLQKMSS